MDKTKSEKLKEILNQKLSSDDIEKKLKEEAKSISEKKELREEKSKIEEIQEETKENKKIREEVKKLEEKIEKKEIEEPAKETQEKVEKKEKVVIPSVRDKEIENKESNLLLYLVSLIAILLLMLTIYLFTKNDSALAKTEETSSKNIVENIENNKAEVKEVVSNEISKVLETKDEAKLEQINEKIEEPNDKLVAESIEEPIKENTNDNEKEITSMQKNENVVIKEKVITKVVNLDKNNFKQYYNSSKYNTLKCYNFKAGNIFPDSKCKKDLVKFIDANKNAIRFEVIPVIAEDDNTIFDKIKPNLTGMEQSFQDRVKEYMFRGLGRERVLETSWQIKDILGEDTVLTPTNYYVKSKKNNKGIVIKAYH